MLLDFVWRRAVVERSGRRFVCAPPTFGAVASFTAHHLGTLRIVMESATCGTAFEWVEPFLIDIGGTADVLCRCVESEGLDRLQIRAMIAVDVELARQLASAVLSLCDTQRIGATFDLSAREASSESAERDDTALDLSVIEAAREFGVDPAAVLEWPYERWLSVRDALDLMHSIRAQRTSGNRSLSWIGPDCPGGSYVGPAVDGDDG